jgi:predicted outer membrane repeat protein
MGPMNHKFLENNTIVNLFGASAPSSATAVRFSMKNYERATVLICQNKSAGNGAAISFNQCTAIAGTAGKTLPFTKAYRSLANGTQAAPVNNWDEFDVTSDTFTTDTTNSVRDMYAVDITREMLDIENEFDVVELEIGNAASNVIQAIALLHVARYGGFEPPSAIAD